MSMYTNDRGYRDYEDYVDRPRSGGLLNTTLSMLAGAAVGAAAMYLFDPDHGTERREHVGAYTGDALKGTGQTLGMAAGQLAETAKELSASLAGALGTAAGATGSAAKDAYDSVADRAARLTGRQRQTNDAWLGDVASHDHSLSAPVAGVSAIGTALLAVGALYLLDPEKRRVAMDSLHRVVRTTGESFHSLGRKVGRGSQASSAGHMDYATSDDYLGATGGPEVGRTGSSGGADVPPQGT